VIEFDLMEPNTFDAKNGVINIVDRDSAPRRARRLAVQSDVGELSLGL
jgi:hypothetical protein